MEIKSTGEKLKEMWGLLNSLEDDIGKLQTQEGVEIVERLKVLTDEVGIAGIILPHLPSIFPSMISMN